MSGSKQETETVHAHARLQARRSDHSGPRGAAGTIRTSRARADRALPSRLEPPRASAL